MFDELVSKAQCASGADAVAGFGRVENAASARRLAAMARMLDDAYAASGSADRDTWCVDNWAMVSARIGAALQVSRGTASHQLIVAVVLRDRLPKVGALFTEGLVSYRLVATIAWRTALLEDPDALGAVDAALAERVRRWGALSKQKSIIEIDAVIAAHDTYALRRSEPTAGDRYVSFEDDGAGYTYLFARLFSTDAQAARQRLDALADTVCAQDPRTVHQRRADGFGAMAHGNDRLACRCGSKDCEAFTNPPATGVVIHVVAPADSLDGAVGPVLPDQRDPADDDEPAEPVEPVERDEQAERVDEVERDERVDDTDGASEQNATDDAPAAVADEDADRDIGPTPIPRHHDSPIHIPPSLAALSAQRAEKPDGEKRSAIAPAYLMGKGGGVLPGVLLGYAVPGATIRPIRHPGNAPPEPGYRPSRALAEFVRARDLTCRFPGCDVPATGCDLDHVDAWPYGATCASGLSCKCRFHHLLKTFCGWSDRQLADGTVIWTAPDGQSYTTEAGSRLLFPSLSHPSAPAPLAEVPPQNPDKGQLTMPRRRLTRAEARQQRVTAERALNKADPTRQPATDPSTSM